MLRAFCFDAWYYNMRAAKVVLKSHNHTTACLPSIRGRVRNESGDGGGVGEKEKERARERERERREKSHEGVNSVTPLPTAYSCNPVHVTLKSKCSPTQQSDSNLNHMHTFPIDIPIGISKPQPRHGSTHLTIRQCLLK